MNIDNKKNVYVSVAADIVKLIIAIFLILGTVFLFPTCDALANGSWMKCHWSGQVIKGVGAILIVLSVISLITKSQERKTGIIISEITISIFLIAVLEGLIGLCGMSNMKCRVVTQPAVIVTVTLFILISIIHLIYIIRNEK